MQISFPDLSNSRVVVVGDVMLDRYWRGDTQRISPEAPVPVMHVKSSEERPGGAGNVAMNIRALGGAVHLLGLIGDDEAGEILQRQLDAADITTDLAVIAEQPTITKLRVVSLSQQLLRLDFEQAYSASQSECLLAAFEAQLAEADLVVLSDYAKGTLSSPQPFIERARAARKPVLVDPKGTDFSRYRGANLLTPNRKEFEAVMGGWKNQNELIAKGREALARFSIDALLVTLGDQGMLLVEQDQEPQALSAEAREVFDVTGAGDTVIAVLASALAAGQSMSEAMRLANTAAGIVVGRLGATSVSATHLKQTLHLMKGEPQGPVNEAELLALVAEAKASRQRIVMTNGCFDLLHAGHVQYLQQAKQLGDKLIVAVNDDASVRQLKGSTRPINPLSRRMAVLAGLAAVDWVVPFSESTPRRLIEAVLPDVLVKGGDYQPKDIAGSSAVVANGGEVKVLPFVEGCSTTAMLAKAQEESA